MLYASLVGSNSHLLKPPKMAMSFHALDLAVCVEIFLSEEYGTEIRMVCLAQVQGFIEPE